MNKLKIKRLSPVFVDNRGSIFDILEEDIKHVGFIISLEGSTRGKHYHKKSTQSTYIVKGKVELKTTNLKSKNNKERTIILDEGDIVVIPPFYSHTYRFLKDSQMIVMTNMTRLKGGYEQDTYRI